MTLGDPVSNIDALRPEGPKESRSDWQLAKLFKQRNEEERVQKKFRTNCLRWMGKCKRDENDDEEGDGPQRKRRRHKSFEMCIHVHNALGCITGALQKYKPDSDYFRAPPDQWPALSIAPDQGPDMHCSVNWLRYGS